MTNKEAISAEIVPYSTDDSTLEKVFIDSASHFGKNHLNVEEEYNTDNLQVIALSAMKILAKMKVLVSDKIDVIGQSYDTNKIDETIASIAASAGLSSSLVGAEDKNNNLTALSVW